MAASTVWTCAVQPAVIDVVGEVVGGGLGVCIPKAADTSLGSVLRVSSARRVQRSRREAFEGSVSAVMVGATDSGRG